MDMMAIDDEAEMAVPVLQRRADHPGLAAAERRHGVEQMREAGQSLVERAPGSKSESVLEAMMFTFSIFRRIQIEVPRGLPES